MRTISYSDVLQRAAEATGRIYADLSVQEAGLLKGFIATRFKQIWEKWAWPDLMAVEQRFFRPEWNPATTYIAGDEVFYTPSQKYYQSLKAANTNNPPATGLPLILNPAWWAESAQGYSGFDFDVAKTYFAGDLVFWPTTQRYYQAHTGGTGNLPGNTAFWGILAPFDRYVAWEQPGFPPLGDVFDVFDIDPDIFTNARALHFWESAQGIQVDTVLPAVWLWRRKQSAFLKGNLFDATKTYAAGEQVYYPQTLASGNVIADFYDCLSATNAGESPASAPAKWSQVSIPFGFGEWLIHAAAADLLSKDGKDDWSGDEMSLANELLLAELDKQERQKDQQPPLKVALRARTY